MKTKFRRIIGGNSGSINTIKLGDYHDNFKEYGEEFDIFDNTTTYVDGYSTLRKVKVDFKDVNYNSESKNHIEPVFGDIIETPRTYWNELLLFTWFCYNKTGYIWPSINKKDKKDTFYIAINILRQFEVINVVQGCITLKLLKSSESNDPFFERFPYPESLLFSSRLHDKIISIRLNETSGWFLEEVYNIGFKDKMNLNVEEMNEIYKYIDIVIKRSLIDILPIVWMIRNPNSLLSVTYKNHSFIKGAMIFKCYNFQFRPTVFDTASLLGTYSTEKVCVLRECDYDMTSMKYPFIIYDSKFNEENITYENLLTNFEIQNRYDAIKEMDRIFKYYLRDLENKKNDSRRKNISNENIKTSKGYLMDLLELHFDKFVEKLDFQTVDMEKIQLSQVFKKFISVYKKLKFTSIYCNYFNFNDIIQELQFSSSSKVFNLIKDNFISKYKEYEENVGKEIVYLDTCYNKLKETDELYLDVIVYPFKHHVNVFKYLVYNTLGLFSGSTSNRINYMNEIFVIGDNTYSSVSQSRLVGSSHQIFKYKNEFLEKVKNVELCLDFLEITKEYNIDYFHLLQTEIYRSYFSVENYDLLSGNIKLHEVFPQLFPPMKTKVYLLNHLKTFAVILNTIISNNSVGLMKEKDVETILRDITMRITLLLPKFEIN